MVTVIYCLGAIPLGGAYFGEGSGVIHIDYVQCSSVKYHLQDCETANNTRLTTHAEDVGVSRQPGKNAHTCMHTCTHTWKAHTSPVLHCKHVPITLCRP